MKFWKLVLIAFFIPTVGFSQMNKAAQASNQFGLDLYRHISKTPGNLFLSPFSIEVALAMTAGGAQEDTLKQMMNTLRLPENYHADFKTLLSQVRGTKDYSLFVANHIWTQVGSPYYPNYLKLLIDNYGAALSPIDFKGNTEGSRQTINQWVEKQTNDKIKELLKPGVLKPDTDLVLTNAIYFKGSWKDEFKKDQTKNEDFITVAAQKESIPFMNRQDSFAYTENRDFQYLQLKYKGNAIVMDIILPQPGVALSAFEQNLSPQIFQDVEKFAYFQEVKLSLPKFRAESEFDLGEKLASLGMPLAFDSKKANFKGMRVMKPNENLFISKVIHKAFVDVSEEGTEAAAATAVVGVITTAMPQEPKIFKANRPFLYFIRHKATGTILFMGRFSQP